MEKFEFPWTWCIIAVIFFILVIYFWRCCCIQEYLSTVAAGSRVLFVTAHPDDECMFFAPSIIRLRRVCSIHLLCLSTGNFYRQGNVRKDELFASCKILGIAEEQVQIIDHRNLPDDPGAKWDTEVVGKFILNYINEQGIEAVVTFDSWGISGHANHLAIYETVKYLAESEQLPCGISAYMLRSVPIWRKYISVLDLAFCRFWREMFLLTPNEVRQAQAAMAAHASQYLWFRRLYILFSRYMIMNELQPLA